jgi:hypothetical protein
VDNPFEIPSSNEEIRVDSKNPVRQFGSDNVSARIKDLVTESGSQFGFDRNRQQCFVAKFVRINHRDGGVGRDPIRNGTFS